MFSYLLLAEDEMPAEIGLVSDSLTTNIQQDSLRVAEAEDISSETKTDSLLDFRHTLKQSLDKIALQENLEIPLDFYYKEDFHLKTAYEQKNYLTINNFTIIDTLRSNLLLLQSYLPFYRQDKLGGQIFLQNSGYDLIVPYTVTYLGLGDEEMNHGFFSFKKGEILGISNLNLETSYLGYAGNWFGINEKASNLDFHLEWNPIFGSIQYNFTNINQDISPQRSKFVTEKDMIEDLSTSHALVFQNAFIDLGWKQSSSSLDSLGTNYSQFFLSKKVQMAQHQMQLTYEKFFADIDLQNIRWLHRSSWAKLNWHNSGFWQDDKQYHYFSEINYQSANFHMGAEISYSSTSLDYRDLLASLGYQASKFSLLLKSGERQIDNDKWQVSQLNFALTLPWHNYSCILSSRWENQPNAPESLPQNQMISEIALALNLAHENRLRMGLLHTYSSNYQQAGKIYLADNLDFFLKVQITRYFEIYGKLVNIFNNDSMYNQLETIPDRHLNYGVKWLFVN